MLIFFLLAKDHKNQHYVIPFFILGRYLILLEIASSFSERSNVNPIKPGGGVIFARGKFKFKLFLNGLWYELETLWLFLTFTRDCFAGKKIQKNFKLSGGNIFLYRGYCQKIGVRICRNSFSCRIKYLHV